jgi:oligopeptide/dipeptide ABC transporter ATP-binding protein
VLDEPTSALDVSVQSTILHLLADLRDKMGMSYLFVSHDLNVVRLICDRIIVMYLGRIVETASTRDLFASPKHPYTRALLSSIPNPRRHGNRPLRLEGATMSPIDPDPAMCRLYGRCPFSFDRCASEYPALRELGHGHLVSCHAANGIADLGTDPQRHSPAKAPE